MIHGGAPPRSGAAQGPWCQERKAAPRSSVPHQTELMKEVSGRSSLPGLPMQAMGGAIDPLMVEVPRRKVQSLRRS